MIVGKSAEKIRWHIHLDIQCGQVVTVGARVDLGKIVWDVWKGHETNRQGFVRKFGFQVTLERACFGVGQLTDATQTLTLGFGKAQFGVRLEIAANIKPSFAIKVHDLLDRFAG